MIERLPKNQRYESKWRNRCCRLHAPKGHSGALNQMCSKKIFSSHNKYLIESTGKRSAYENMNNIKSSNYSLFNSTSSL